MLKDREVEEILQKTAMMNKREVECKNGMSK